MKSTRHRRPGVTLWDHSRSHPHPHPPMLTQEVPPSPPPLASRSGVLPSAGVKRICFMSLVQCRACMRARACVLHVRDAGKHVQKKIGGSEARRRQVATRSRRQRGLRRTASAARRRLASPCRSLNLGIKQLMPCCFHAAICLPLSNCWWHQNNSQAPLEV